MKNKASFICLAFFVCAIQLIQCQEQDLCVNKISCHACIQTKDCAWCSQTAINQRCFNVISNPSLCDTKHTETVANQRTLIVDKEVSQPGENQGDIVQIRPQKIGLSLRVDTPFKFTVQYKQAKDYPVDLYYLMDISNSMQDDKDKLMLLGKRLGDEMKQITNDFRLGFGSFVDKPVLPFADLKTYKKSCSYCTAPYGFQNHMILTDNIAEFVQNVKNTKISISLDLPEGGFDALIQAMVCKNEIGWRQQSRKIIVLCTDAPSHSALDGRLAGIIVPNDGECHLTNNAYTHTTEQDYPSIPQINLKAKQNSVNIIFAITKNVSQIYEKLATKIDGSYVALLSDDSSNIVDLIKDQYKKISSSIELKDNANDDVELSYSSSCLKGGPEVHTNKCDGLKMGDTVNFTVTVSVRACPKNRAEWKRTIQINTVGINETLIVDLNMLCSCPCEDDEASTKSVDCSRNGWLKCGICECQEKFLGSNCQCLSNSTDSELGLLNQCRENNDAPTCSDRGTCICGVCTCDEDNTGKYCQCDNNSCERNKNTGQLCSGADKGICDCGICRCRDDWIGEACDCRLSNETCIRNVGEDICSGHGNCKCGECICDQSSKGYNGRFCEKCSNCDDRCSELKDCVECQVFKTGKLLAEKCQSCAQFQISNHANLTQFTDDEDFQKCAVYDKKNECRMLFVYNEMTAGAKVIIHAQKTMVCKQNVDLKPILIWSISSIVIFGVLTLLFWKVVTTIHDKKEYAKFLKNKQAWKPVENPLYKEAKTKTTNPTFEIKE